jgi:glutaminyl-peptide cyclotransferase
MNQESKIKRQPSKIALHSSVLVFSLLLAGGCPSKTSQDANERSGKPSTMNPQTSNRPAPPVVARYGYKVVKEYPHDPCAFTQGLVYENGFLYEGTGLYGQSKLIKRNFKTWDIVKQIDLPGIYFGEGIALVGDRIVQLTWQEHAGFVYDKNTLAQISHFVVTTEGWGLTFDGSRLILSDGTNTLSFLDPNTFARTGQIRVMDRSRMVRLLNELEYIDGSIYANILGDWSIAILSPQTGNVTGWINLAGLYTPPPDAQDNFVLNGIAWLPESKHLLVTGKCWTKMFEIELVPQR